MTGVEGAFRQVVEAYAAGNRNVLKERLTPDAYAAFDAALTAREQAGETQKSEIRGIDQAKAKRHVPLPLERTETGHL